MSASQYGDELDRWARLRFSIIGPLLAAPPAHGELQQALRNLSAQPWRHPITGVAVQFSVATLERWFYAARSSADPVSALRRKRHTDAGRVRRLNPALIQALEEQYRQHAGWTKHYALTLIMHRHRLYCLNNDAANRQSTGVVPASVRDPLTLS